MKPFLGCMAALAVAGILFFAQGCANTENSYVPANTYDQERIKHAGLVEQNDQLEKQIANLHTVIDNLNKEIAKRQPLSEEVGKLQADRDALMAEVDRLNVLLKQRDETLDQMSAKLKVLTGMDWTVFAGGLKVPLQGDVLFDSGSAVLNKKSGIQALQKLQEAVDSVLGKYNVKIEYVRIDGHTDTDPIKHSGFADNWILGATRANAVRMYLEELGWKSYKMQIGSFAYTVPVADGDSKEAKAKNRRVEIYIVPAINSTSGSDDGISGS